uniref:Endonuclease/exonuclease/phosphatase domain-containing protein n=1 Tax=Latimeria chalumnae TaxID=7897 RepID=H2ZY84_LATCH
GVAILVNRNLPFHAKQIKANPKGRNIIGTAQIYSENITIASVYVPTIDDLQFVQNTAQFPDSLIIGGDNNCTLDTDLDRSSNKPATPTRMAKILRDALEENGMSEIWRHMHQTRIEFSLYPHVHWSFSRINLLLVSKKISYRIEKNYCITDHLPIFLDLKTPTNQSYRWRFDSTLLNRQEFKDMISKSILEFLEINMPTAPSPECLWDSLKASLRGLIISYSSKIKRQAQKEYTELEHELKKAKKNNTDLHNTVVNLQQKLKNQSVTKAEKAILRIKATYYAQGNRAGKVLAWQLERENVSRLIPTISTQSGTLT